MKKDKKGVKYDDMRAGQKVIYILGITSIVGISATLLSAMITAFTK